ncbi:MAG TPA: sigma-70 family RNA polymerase sigma factor [Patescibacteria group bacterium]|nr:sigma-70 family RNA polymerase sigma factor [Patescibacteria group bacterium]
MSDAELIAAYRHGDKEALEILIKRYLAPVYRFLLRLVHNQETANDLSQETFFKAWRSLWRFDAKRSFKTWLFTIAKNTAFDYLKKKKAFVFSELDGPEDGQTFDERIPDERPLAFELIEQHDQAQFVNQILALVSPQARSIILMHDGEDMTFQEISSVMHESLNTVKSRYRRALLLLQKKMKDLNNGSVPGISLTHAPK